MQYCKSLLFIKHSQWEQKLKTWQEQPDLVCGCFTKVFYKKATCPRLPLLSGPNQEWLSYTGLTVYKSLQPKK